MPRRQGYNFYNATAFYNASKSDIAQKYLIEAYSKWKLFKGI